MCFFTQDFKVNILQILLIVTINAFYFIYIIMYYILLFYDTNETYFLFQFIIREFLNYL